MTPETEIKGFNVRVRRIVSGALNLLNSGAKKKIKIVPFLTRYENTYIADKFLGCK